MNVGVGSLEGVKIDYPTYPISSILVFTEIERAIDSR